MEDELLESTALTASITNPNDMHEVTMQADAVSVGITDPLFGSGKRVKWTKELLKKFAPTFKNMPVTAEIREEDGTLVPHSKVTIGSIVDAYYDDATDKVVTDAVLWNHYYPDTISQAKGLYEAKGDDGKSGAEVSWEFDPISLEASPEDGENVWIPTDGRFAGLAIVAKGADQGQRIRLFASAMDKEHKAIVAKTEEVRPGTYEWIGDAIAQHLTAGGDTEEYTPKTVIATYADRAIYRDNGSYFALPYTIEGSEVKFSDTIEVEPTFQPLGASAAGSVSDPEPTPTAQPVKEAEKPVDPKELATLQAAADRVPALETENSTLKTEKTTLETERDSLKTELETLKAANEERERTEKAERLAASRQEEIEKIAPYTDDKQKKEDFEAFKTMDDAAFEIVKRVLTASQGDKGGVANEGTINPPTKTPQDPDGQAAAIVESDEFKRLLASYADPEDTK